MSEVKLLNFEVVELTGATKEDAFNKAPFFISGDATQSYKKWEEKQEGVITDAMKREFFISYLNFIEFSNYLFIKFNIRK